MGNTCSDSFNNRNGPQFHEIHVLEFKKTYLSLRFPQNVSFVHDPSTFRIKVKSTGQGRILKRFTFSNPKDLCQFTDNLERVIRLEHDNLLRIYNYSVEKNQINDCTVSYTVNIILEHFDHTLQDELAYRSQSHQDFTEKDALRITTSLVDSLAFLQMKNVFHGDIKSNIYITSDRQAKLMYLGDLPQTVDSETHVQEALQVSYMAPQVRNQMNETCFSDKNSLDLQTNEAFNLFKADVFSLGLIILEMMSMKNVNGLNGNDCERIRQYRVAQCYKKYGSSLCGLVEAMLKDSELIRPDPIDLQKLIVMEEYIDYASEKGVYLRAQTNSEELRNIIEMRTIKNRTEKYYVDRSSELTEMSILMEMEDEAGRNKRKILKLDDESVDLGHELSPTKAYTSQRDGSHGRKDYDEVREPILGELDEEDEGDFGFLEEIFIENEKDLEQAMLLRLKKLVINFEEKAFNKETGSKISKLLSDQPFISDLMLGLSKMKLGDEGLGLVCEGLKQTRDIERCYLDFRKNKITDEGLTCVKACLMDKEKLVQLGLNLSDNRISDNGCKEVVSWFEDLKDVKSLALNLGGNKITNQGLVEIGQNLKEMKVLECLVIFLHANEIEGDEGIRALFKGLRRIMSLRKLKIDLSSNLLEDEEIEEILSFINEDHIEEITIELKDNCMSEEGRGRILAGIKNKEKVSIDF